MADFEASFVVARNPEPDSTLPFLLSVPLDGGILLKARERWPATARVYCHPLEHWPANAEILEQVAGRPVQCERHALRAGDYAVRAGDAVIATVERKTLEDLTKALVDGALNYALADLSTLPAAAVVVEGRYGALLNNEHVQPGWLL